jgi:hypothetical protein
MIVIPMAGLSRRFAEAGYTRPKYMLDLHGRSVFAHAVGSFARFFASLPFLFVLRDVQGTAAFVAAECRALGIRDHASVALDAPTAGQAETVALGLRRAAVAASEPVTIFNIDTFRPGFDFPRGFDPAAVDGYLEVFRGGGPNWSYVRPVAPGSDRVAETAEKRPISDLCCTGLYHFARAGDFQAATAAFARDGRERTGLSELYVAPIYNSLIAAGADIRFAEIAAAEVLFCGVPAEYEALRALPAMPRTGGG